MRESKNEFKTLVFSILIVTTYICYIFLIFVAYSQHNLCGFTDFDVQFSTFCKDDNEITTMTSTINASSLAVRNEFLNLIKEK